MSLTFLYSFSKTCISHTPIRLELIRIERNKYHTWQCTVAHHPRPLVGFTRQLPRVMIPVTADFRRVAVTPVPRMRRRCHVWATGD